MPPHDGVICLSLQVYTRYLESLGRDPAPLFDGLSYPREHLLNPNSRIDFGCFREISHRFSAMVPDQPDAAFRAGCRVPQTQALGFIDIIAGLYMHPALIYWMTPKLVHKQFPMVRATYQRTGATSCLIRHHMPYGHSCFAEYVDVARGIMTYVPLFAGLPPAQVTATWDPRQCTLIVDWPRWGSVVSRARALTVGRLQLGRAAVQELEASKTLIEAQLEETRELSQRLQALLTVGRAVERGLDVDELIAEFCDVARQELGLEVWHVAVPALQVHSGTWDNIVQEMARTSAHASRMCTVALPDELQHLISGKDLAWASAFHGPRGLVGVAVFSSSRDLNRPQGHRELVRDAFARLGHALNNALQHRELNQYRSTLEQQVAARTDELQQHADQLRQTNTQLVELDHAKRRLFTHMSHELRTPVTLLSTSLEAMESVAAPWNPQSLHLLSMARSNVSRLVQAVDDLLDLALLDESRMQVHFERVDVVAICSAVCESVSPWATARRISVSMDAPQQGIWLRGDRRLLDKAALNLVANAIKFSPSDSSVEVVVERLEDSVCIHVLDRGPGVNEHDRTGVFEAFRQGQPCSSEQGIGIGLSLVHAVAITHRGQARVQPRPGGGSDFSLEVALDASEQTDAQPKPWRRPEVSDVHQQAQALLGQQQRAVVEVQDAASAHERYLEACWPSAVRDRVLLVDDEPQILEMLVLGLEADFDTVPVAGGHEALAALEAGDVSAVVTDISMPGMTGVELCAAVRRHSEARALPVIVLTAAGAVEQKLRAFEAGADDYLTKPFSMMELRARVRTQIQLRKLMQEVHAQANSSIVGNLAAGLAHEVKNPLNVLINSLEPLRKAAGSGDAATIQMLLQLIDGAAERILGCVDSIGNLSSWSAGSAERVDLQAFLGSLVQSRRARSGHHVALECSCEIEGTVGLRRTEASIILGSLLDNAIDAAPENSTVRVIARDAGAFLTVEVCDEGSGMDRQTLRRATEPFFTTKPPGNGTGLGLFVVKEIVSQLKGRLEIKTIPGEGTSASVYLPKGV